MAALNIKAFTPHYEVVANGVVIIPSDSYVEFSILDLKYRFSFLNDETERVHYAKNMIGEDTPNEYMDIVFYNVPSTLLATPSNVIELGTIDDKKLCLRFSISTIQRENNSDLIIMYNWLMER